MSLSTKGYVIAIVINGNKLGNFLRRARERKGLTQMEVAERTDLKTYQALYQIEVGNRIPPLKSIKRMCDLYGIPTKKVRLLVVKYLLVRLKRKYGIASGSK